MASTDSSAMAAATSWQRSSAIGGVASRRSSSSAWRADSYLYGVWNLLTGKEAEGYARLEECVRHNSDYMKDRLKEFPNACNDPRDAMAVMYRNAQLFLETKEISDAQKRWDVTRETYEKVCRFMRYYHSLAKKTERP